MIISIAAMVPGAGSALSASSPRDAAFLEKLQHDVHVRAFAAQLFHEIFQNRVHHRILFRGYGVDRHIAKEDRVGADSQIMLHFAENNLLLSSSDA